MSNPNPQDAADQLMGRTAVDADGDKIGTIEQVYVNDATGQPEWVTVKTGMFGTKESFAPLYRSTAEGDTVRLAVTKDVVKGAPNIDNDGHTDDADQRALYEYYAGELGWAQSGGPSYDDRGVEPERESSRGVQGHGTSGPNTDEAMTRSEERLHVGTEQVEAGRARLRKYIVTENVTTTVPVSHEEVRVEREPITDANRDQAMAGGELSEEEHEVVLHAERPVVDKETVPVERVRLGTETVTDEHEVSEQVRKEQIEHVSDTETGTGSQR